MVDAYFGGSSGFTSNGDEVDANLNITLPDEAARNLWDVQAAIQQIATDFQTAVRSASDFNSYLISIRETSQTVRMPSLGLEGGEGGNMTYSGGRVDTGSVPGFLQSEAGMADRISEMQENSSGAGGGVMGARSPSGQPIDVGAFEGQLANAGWMASMTVGHREIPGSTSAAYQRNYEYAQNNPKDPLVRRAAYGGQQGTPHAFAASRLLSQGLPAAQMFLRGGGAGGIAGMLGRAGTWGAIGYAGYELVNAGMETYAQSRSLSMEANNSQNGIGWGFLDARLPQAEMAMSPFVSQEEAAQIYNMAIAQGWASRTGAFQQGNFSQAVNFMYGAAKDYNMDPTMSAQLLQTNSLGAGESVQTLSEQLLTLKKTLDGTGVSLDTANAAFTSFTGQLIAAGASGPGAAQVAGGALSAYAKNTYLGPSGRGAQIVAGTLGTQQTQNILAGLTGTIPGAALAGSHLQASTAELDNLTKRFADQAMSMTGLDTDSKAAMFMQLYNGTFGTNIDETDARNMMLENVSSPNLLSAGQKTWLQHQGLTYQSRSGWDQVTGGLYDDLNSWSSLGQNFLGLATVNSTRNYSPEIKKLLDNSANSDNTQVIDDKGNVVATGKDQIGRWFSDQSNFNRFSAAGSKYTIKDNGTTWNAASLSGATSTGDVANPAANTVYITLSPQAQQWFATNTSTLNLSTGASVANTGN